MVSGFQCPKMIGQIAPQIRCETTGLATVLLGDRVRPEACDELIVILPGEVDPILVGAVSTIGIDLLESVTDFDGLVDKESEKWCITDRFIGNRICDDLACVEVCEDMEMELTTVLRLVPHFILRQRFV